MKIELRKLNHTHVFTLISIVKQDIANSAYLTWPFTKEVAIEFISSYNTWGIWVNGGILVGVVEVKDTLETAYFVSKPWKNKGIATAAINACKAHFGTKQLWCYINPNNTASRRVAEKAKLRVQFFN
jgi:RimJ/RimL family protein N-acetyltransferase